MKTLIAAVLLTVSTMAHADTTYSQIVSKQQMCSDVGDVVALYAGMTQDQREARIGEYKNFLINSGIDPDSQKGKNMFQMNLFQILAAGRMTGSPHQIKMRAWAECMDGGLLSPERFR